MTVTIDDRKRRIQLRALLWSTGVSVMGDGIFVAAVPLMAASLTRDPSQVALISASAYAAQWLFGLPAGALVDRWSRRMIMVVSDLLRAIVLLAVVALTFMDRLTIPLLASAVFIIGIGSCFFAPAAQTMIPAVVGRDPDALAHANGRFWAIDTFGRSLAGPPIGAAIFAAARAIPFLADALSFVVSAVLVKWLPDSRVEATQHPSLWRSIREGVVFLATHRDLRALVLGMASYNFGYNVAFATLVLFAQDELQLGSFGFGLLIAAMAAGGVLSGSFVTPRIPSEVNPRMVYGVALLLQACAWLAVMASPSVWVAGPILAVIGGASTAVSVVGGAARQRLTPDALLGRVVAATRLVGIGISAFGALLGGWCAARWGLDAPFIAAGVCLLACSAIFVIRRR